jgi:hypothetical protein
VLSAEPPYRGTGQAIGQVKSVLGQATLSRAGLTPLEPGTLIEPGDLLITQAEGYVGLTFIDDSRFTIGPRTRVKITHFQLNPTTQEGQFAAALTQGQMAVTSGSAGLHVHTPRATVRPVGTTAIAVEPAR